MGIIVAVLIFMFALLVGVCVSCVINSSEVDENEARMYEDFIKESKKGDDN